MSDQRLEIVLAAKDLSGKAFKSVQGHITRLTKQIFSVRGALAGIAGAAGLGLVIKKQLEYADSIAKTADRIGITTDALQKRRYMADRAGVSNSELDTGLEAFTKRLGELRQGTGALNTYLTKLDENFKNQVVAAGSVDDALGLVIKRLQETTDQSDRAALAAAAFGRTAGVKMTLVAKDADELAKRFERLGLAVDERLLRNSEKGIDAITDLSYVLKTSFMSVVTELAPDVAALATSMADWVAQNKEFLKQDIKTAINDIGEAVGGLVDIYESLPDHVVGAAGAGLVAAIIGRSSTIGAVAAALVLLKKDIDDMWTASNELVDIFKATMEGENYFDWKAKQARLNQGAGGYIDERASGVPGAGPIRIKINKPGNLLPDLGVDFSQLPDYQKEVPWSISRDWSNLASEFRDVSWDMQRALSDNFFDPVSESFLDLQDLGLNVIDSIKDHILNRFSQSIVDQIIGVPAGRDSAGTVGWLGMAASWLASLFHEGGKAGTTPAPMRAISPALFLNAPRLHSGLRPDEMPAILQRGETVIPKGAQVMPNIEIKLINKSSRDMTAEQGPARMDGGKIMLDLVLREINTNYSYKQAFKASLG